MLLKPVVDPTQMDALLLRNDNDTVEDLIHQECHEADKACSHCLQVLLAKYFSLDAQKYARGNNLVKYRICT